MKAVVISGGRPVSKDRAITVLEEADIIICADKGAEYAALYEVVPDYIVGDMDSVDERALNLWPDTEIIVSKPEKDFTDTHLAVRLALSEGASDITLLCATGSRSDHALANIRLLLAIDAGGACARIIDDDNTIFLCTGATEFTGKIGKTVSIMTLSEHVSRISLEGFKYPLSDFDAGLAWTTGISNIIVSDPARITIGNGRLLVFEIH